MHRKGWTFEFLLKFPLEVMAFTYILFSDKVNQYYIGSTNDLEQRLKRHNNGTELFTKRGSPWKLVYSEMFDTKAEAMKREREIKSKKSRSYIEWLISEKQN